MNDSHTLCQQPNMYSLKKAGRDHLATLPARTPQKASPENL